MKVSQLCLGAMMSGACGNADLSQAHRHDPDVDHEETLGARSGVIAWGPLNMGWLTGTYRRGHEPPPGSRGVRNWGNRFDTPESERKLDLVEVLLEVASDAGIPLTHLAQGWMVRHPGVTSAIVGPRTTEQLTDLLAGQDVVLDDATLDRIDELVAPGTNINPVDAGWTSPAPSPVARRR